MNSRSKSILATAFAVFFLLGTPHQAVSDGAYVQVGSAKAKRAVIAFPNAKTSNQVSLSLFQNLKQVITADLNFMGMFKFLDPSAFVESEATGVKLGTFKLSDWTGIGAEVLIKTELSLDSDHGIQFEIHLYEVLGAKEILAKKYVASKSETRVLGHTVANDIVHALTGGPGIFLTKIAMTCDLTGKKEIYTMNYDGSDAKQVTHHRSLAFAPAWSPDGTRIAYSLFTRHRNNTKNIDLYEFNFVNHSVRLLSSKQGINSGAAYSPDGKKLALTMSFQGNPEIFILDLATGAVKKITKSFGFDVDPNWSPDGKEISFVSSRTGMPMVFSMKSDGSDVDRLTFAGRYNATPTWSPRGNKIGFAGWIDRSFDIFIMNPDGTKIERLTKAQGNNEDPYFSPDGNFLVFSSNRSGQKNIYSMNLDGGAVRRLTYGLGNCVSPKWSNAPAQ